MRRNPYLTLFAVACLAMPLGAAAKPQPAATTKPVENLNSMYPNPAANGIVRVAPRYFGPQRPSDIINERPADPSQRIFVFEGTIDNERALPYTDEPQIQITDAEGVMADTRSIAPADLDLPAAAGATVRAVFWAPKEFVPLFIVYNCQNVKCKTIRIKLKR